jgi:cytochrome c553
MRATLIRNTRPPRTARGVVAALWVAGAAGATGVCAAPPAPPAVALCAACHGADGAGRSDGVPRLAGQDADYLAHALASFKDGSRISAVMQPIASPLDAAQMRSLALYYSAQTAVPADIRAGRELAHQGAAGVPACFGCHGAQGQGDGAKHPRLAGQPVRYTVERLRQFQSRAGAGKAPAGTMTAVAAAMTAAQVDAAAAYLSQVQP